jgi:pilus assembly protein CpaC
MRFSRQSSVGLRIACLIGLLASAAAARGQDRNAYPLPSSPAIARELSNISGLHPQIASLPDVTARMKVVQRRSQLIVTRSAVVRTAVADPSVVDVVQFSATEIAVIGLELGSTTLTLWFEGNPDPLIYLVEAIRDPSIEERQRVDYGRLEQKLAVLFPNSKVYLIPLSGKIIVKGQARDSEEAARILSIVRGEVINQNGSLGGPQPAALTGSAANFSPTSSLLATDLAAGNIVNLLDVRVSSDAAGADRRAETLDAAKTGSRF